MNRARLELRLFLIVQCLLSSAIFDIGFLRSFKRLMLGLFIDIGKGTTIAHGSLIKCEGCDKIGITIGKNVEIASGITLDCTGGLRIEDEVWVSDRAMIYTHLHVTASRILKNKQKMRRIPLVIERDAWIGANAMIYPRVRRIGTGAIVGAGSVVCHDIDDWQIVVGNPAEPISHRIGRSD